jgi:hypothetical protein
MGIELFQPSLILLIRILRCLASRIARISAEGTINSEILWITLASFLFRIISQVSLNKLSRNKESSGNVCSVSRKVWHKLLLETVVPNSDLFMKLPLVTSRVS